MDGTMSRRSHCFTYNRLYSVPFAYVLVSMTDCHMDKGHYESCDIAVNQLRIINLFTALRPPWTDYSLCGDQDRSSLRPFQHCSQEDA